MDFLGDGDGGGGGGWSYDTSDYSNYDPARMVDDFMNV
jgi:hypothetical protein